MSHPSSSLQATFAKAVGAYNAGHFAEAERNCRLVLSARPNVFDARYLLALIQAGLGQHKQAVESFDKALALKPGVAEVLNAKATSLQQLGRSADAVAAYDKAIAANPGFAEGYFNRGTALETLGRHEEALASYDRAIAIRPNFVEAHKNHPVFGKEVQFLSAASEAVMGVAMNMMGWSQAGKIDLVPLVANRFLLMMSQLAVSYVLLDAGVKAEAALAKLPAEHADRSFYEGKRYSALWYARNVLPQAKHHAEVALLEDESPVKISDEAYGHS